MVSIVYLSLIVTANILSSHCEYQNNGIEFVYQQKLLLAEKFINVQFLVPLPKLNETIDEQIKYLTTTLSNAWSKYEFGCDLSNMSTNETSLNFELISKHVEKQLLAAKVDIKQLQEELFETMGSTKTMRNYSANRNKRGAGLIAFGALTALSAGAGIACSLGSIFGGCGGSSHSQDDIDNALQELEENKYRWTEVNSKLNKKFFIIASQMKDIQKTQSLLIKTQKNHTITLNSASDLLNNNTRRLMACNQYFYARDEMLHVQTNLAASLLAINNEIKAYRVAVYAYKLNLLNSVMSMVNKVIPMSLLPRSMLFEILQKVALTQVHQTDRLTLAIPTNQILTYYETKIITNVAVVNSGMIFTLAVPFASGSTALNLFRANPVPMPNGGEDGYASQYELESNYIAIAESTNRIALLSQPQIENCVGSSSFSVCINGFSLETAENTCLGSLLIGNQFSALQNCNILTVKLPIKEKAKNLGNGKWLITSSSKNFDIFLSDLKNTDHLKRTKLPGCQVCVLELKCGTKIKTSSMELRADMFSCKNDSAIKIDILCSISSVSYQIYQNFHIFHQCLKLANKLLKKFN